MWTAMLLCLAIFANEKMIEEVKSGKRTEALASWWGFKAENATACLQAAVDSGVKKLTIDNVGHEWLVEPINLRANLELIIADGVVVRAMPGKFMGGGDCLFSAWDTENITISGKGSAVLMMNKTDYQKKPYRWAEWRHLLSFRGCKNLVVRNITLKDSGGDGIYLANGKRNLSCQNVLVEDVISSGNHRQGFSIISAEDVVIRNSKFINTSGTPPQAGLDLEPNNSRNALANILVEDCEFTGNHGYGILMAAGILANSSKPVGITIRNCKVADNGGGVALQSPAAKEPATGFVTVENVTITGKSDYGVFRIINQPSNGIEIDVRNSEFDASRSRASGIVLNNSPRSDFGRVKFDNITLKQGRVASVIFNGHSGSGIVDLSGNINVVTLQGKTFPFDFDKFISANQPNPELKNFAVREYDLKKLKPLSSTAVNPEIKTLLRTKLRFFQYFSEAGDYELKFKAAQVFKTALNIKIDVTDIYATPIESFYVTDKEFTHILSIKNPGLHIFDVDTRGQVLALDFAFPGQVIDSSRIVRLFRVNPRRLYFHVPAGIADINIKFFATQGEPLNARLLNPDGKVVTSFSRMEGSRLLSYKRDDITKDEIWSFEIHASHTPSVQIGAPLLPFFAIAPENLLIEK